jgi:hypothetical protein
MGRNKTQSALKKERARSLKVAAAVPPAPVATTAPVAPPDPVQSEWLQGGLAHRWAARTAADGWPATP